MGHSLKNKVLQNPNDMLYRNLSLSVNVLIDISFNYLSIKTKCAHEA